MEQKNDTLGVEDIVFMLLETLKSNGTFDEIRRHCVTDIDAKPTYQNWKQRIESNVNKFLSKVKYTPELNKNTIRERLRKHLLDGRETQDIEEGADRILTQVLAPRSLSIFEPKIAVAVNEYLGIKNEAPPIEQNGLKESSLNSIKVSNVEISPVFNPIIDFIPDTANIACDNKAQKGDTKDLRSDKKEKSSSLCKEPKSLNGSRSDDENDAGGSSKQKCSQHKNKTSTSDKSKSSSTNHKSSKKDNSCKEVVEKSKDVINNLKDIVNKPKDTIDKSKNIVNKPKDINDKSKDVIKSKDIVDKSKDIVIKPKDINEKSKDVIKSKDIVEKSKDIVNKPKDIVDKSKDIVNKPKDNVDKSKDKSFSSKNSHSNSSSHKSNRTDTKRTKRSLEEKKKSSSLCKEPKLLNGNRSDDESNSGGSSKQKSTIHKNKSSSSDKTKSSSSNHKSSRRDNNSTDVVDKSKDKSLSKNSSSTDIVNKSKDKSLSKNSSSTDIVNKSKDKSLSKNSSSTDIVNKSKDKSLSKNSSSTDIVNKSKDKSLSKNLSTTDVEKTKDKSLSKYSSSNDIDKSKNKSFSKNSSCIDIADKSKNKSLLTNSSNVDVTKKSKTKSSSLKNDKYTNFDKSKDKYALSKDSSSSSHKSNRNDTKRLKMSHEDKNKLPTNKVSVEEKKPEKSEWNDFRSSIITNDEQDAANVLLSMSAISYESSHSEIITENIIFIEKSPPNTETLKAPITENGLEVEENSDQTTNLLSSDNDDKKENSQLKTNNLETSQSLNSVKSLSNISHLFQKTCSVDIKRLTCKDIKLQCSSVNNVEITEEHQKPAEKVVDEKESKISNVEIDLDPSENDKTNESNNILKVPKLKLKLLPNQIDSMNRSKRKKHHKDKESKKLKHSKFFDIPSEVSVSVDVVSTNMCEKIDQHFNNDTDLKMRDSASTSSNQILHNEIEKNSANVVLDDDKSLYNFKGFSEADAIPCKNFKLLKDVIKTLQAEINIHDKIDNGFKGFTNAEINPCKHRDIVYGELIKLKESKSSTGFLGFSEEETKMSIGHKYVLQQLELAKKKNNVDDHQQNVNSDGTQNGNTFNEVMAAYLYDSNNDNGAASNEIYNQPINDKKKDCPTVNNNNHNHDNWVVEQEMKYKLLPVKVKLERLMEFGLGSANNAKRVSDSTQVPI